jgi:hypothetical protein
VSATTQTVSLTPWRGCPVTPAHRMTLSGIPDRDCRLGSGGGGSTPPGITPWDVIPGGEWQLRLLPFQASSARLSDHRSSRARCSHRQCAGGITQGPGRHPRGLKASGEHRPENDWDFAIYYRDCHARHGILTSCSLDLVGDRRAAFPTVLAGNQICRLRATAGREDLATELSVDRPFRYAPAGGTCQPQSPMVLLTPG